jgi:hypothetical protein
MNASVSSSTSLGIFNGAHSGVVYLMSIRRFRTLELLPRGFWQHRARQDSPKTAQWLTHMEDTEMDTEETDHVC